MGCAKSKQLTSEDLAFLEANTRYEEKTLHAWFKWFNKECRNGQVTQEKFVDMYKMLFPGGNAEKFCNYVFKTYDTNSIGYLDFNQFIIAIDTTKTESAEEKLKMAFRMYDLDGNGGLDLDEMIKIVEDIYAMQRVYSKLGANNAKPTKTAEEQASDIFAQIDEDGDGNVTEEEFLAGCLENENLFKMMIPNIF